MHKETIDQTVTLDGVEYAAGEVTTIDGKEQYVSARDAKRWEKAITKLVLQSGGRGPEATKWLRKQAGLSQDELAQRLGVNRNTVRRWEAGEQETPISAWTTIALLIRRRDETEQLLKAAQHPVPPGTKVA